MTRRPKIKHAPKKRTRLSGGPFSGKYLMMPANGTIHFTVKEFTGYYQASGQWRDAK